MFRQYAENYVEKEEVWSLWKSKANICALGKIYVSGVYDVIGAFYIVLVSVEDESKRIKILYEQSVESHQRTNAILMKKRLFKHIDTKQELIGTVYRIENSCYAKWLSDESFGLVGELEYIHLVIVGENCVVDVVAGYEPKIIHID